MKILQAIMPQPGGIEFQQVARPQVQPGEVLTRLNVLAFVDQISMCITDCIPIPSTLWYRATKWHHCGGG